MDSFAWADFAGCPRAPSPTPIGASEAKQVVLDQRTARLQADTAALVQLDHQISSIDSNIVDLEKQLLLLNEVIQMSRSEREDLLRRREVVRTNTQALRRSLCPASMCTEDVLRVVFHHLISSFHLATGPCNHLYGFHGLRLDLLTPDIEREYEMRARAPNYAASVCAAWRAAALTCPSIWGTIVIRALNRDAVDAHNRQARYLSRVLSRSGATPLDIFVHTLVDSSAHNVGIMDQLYCHAHRWRRFEFSSSRGCTIPIHKYLRGSAPLLEELRVTCEHDDAPSPGAWAVSQYYLGGSPRLRDVKLSFLPFALNGSNESLSLISRLKLTLHDTIPSTLFWNMFQLPALECLDLSVPGTSLILERPADSFELPALRHLTLREYAAEIPAMFQRAFRSKVLNYCCFDHTWPSDRPVNFIDLADFFGLCSTSLSSVAFSQVSLSANDGAMLAAALDKAIAIDFNGCTLDARCIAAFSVGLSALEQISLLDTALLDDAIEALIDFVRHKNPCRRAKEEEVQTHKRLTSVQLSGWDFDLGFSQRDRLEINQLVDG